MHHPPSPQAARRVVAKANKGTNPNYEFQEMINDFTEGQVINEGMPADMIPSDRKITVCVRKRPLGKKELDACDVDVTSIPDGENMLLHECKLKVDLTKYLEQHEFRFDHSFDDTVQNAEVYKFTAQPLVRTIFDKGMATCFAYGQTGSGKTYTMMGVFKEGARTPDSSSGIYAMAAADVFRYAASIPPSFRFIPTPICVA
jgi:kinesin family protein 2/24